MLNTANNPNLNTSLNFESIMNISEVVSVISLFIISFLLLSIVIRKKNLAFKKMFIFVLILVFLCSVLHLFEYTDILTNYMGALLGFKVLTGLIAIMATIIVIKVSSKDINIPSYEELKSSLFEDMYDVLSALPVGIIVSNNNGQIVYANRYIQKLFGYKEDELFMQYVEILLPNKNRKDHIEYRNSFFKNPTEKLMGSGRVLEGLTKNGETKYLEIALKPMSLDIKSQGNLIIAISDVTNDHNNKKLIDNKNQLINVATFGIPSLLSYLDKDGYYQFVNDAYTKYWEKKAEAIIGSHYSQLLPKSSLSQVEKNIQKTLNGNEVNFKIQMDFPSMDKRNLDVFYIPHYNENKTEVLGIVVLAHDYTELMNTKDELEEKNKQLEEYAFLVSHDLRAPVRHISNFLELLKHEFELREKITPKEEKYINVILENSTKIQRMISGMLKIASINQVLPKIEAININNFLTSFFKDHYPHVILSINTSLNSDSFINADKDLLSLIFNNLIQNSLKFTEEPPCMININISLRDEKIEIIFKDHGKGIPEENLTNIFAAFFKDQTSDGLGLGLNIVKKAVMKLSGNIQVTSSDKGATFILEFDRSKIQFTPNKED